MINQPLSLNNHMMSEEFGYWWPAGYEKYKVAGRLVPTEIGATLHLAFDNPNTAHDVFFSIAKGVYGLTSSRAKITLLDFFETQSTGNYSGTISKEFHVNKVLRGAHVPIDGNNKYRSATLCWTSLKVLFGKTGFSIEKNDGDHLSMCLHYDAPDTIEFDLKDGLNIKLSYSLNKVIFPSIQTENIDISEIVFVQLTPKSPEDLEYFLRIIPELRDFFSLCNGEYCPPSCLSLVADFDVESLDGGEIVCQMVSLPINYMYKPESSGALHPTKIFIPYQEFSEIISAALSSWQKNAEMLGPVRSLYFSALYTDRSNSQANFLALSQAVEVFHRRFRKGAILPELEFKKGIKRRLLDALAEHPHQEQRLIFRQRIGYLNEYSLRDRIYELFSEHDTVFTTYVGDWTILAKRISEARNYYTHYTISKKRVPPSFRDLLECLNSLSLLMNLCLLNESGIPNKILHSQALKSRKYKWMFAGFRKIEKGP